MPQQPRTRLSQMLKQDIQNVALQLGFSQAAISGKTVKQLQSILKQHLSNHPELLDQPEFRELIPRHNKHPQRTNTRGMRSRNPTHIQPPLTPLPNPPSANRGRSHTDISIEQGDSEAEEWNGIGVQPSPSRWSAYRSPSRDHTPVSPIPLPSLTSPILTADPPPQPPIYTPQANPMNYSHLFHGSKTPIHPGPSIVPESQPPPTAGKLIPSPIHNTQPRSRHTSTCVYAPYPLLPYSYLYIYMPLHWPLSIARYISEPTSLDHICAYSCYVSTNHTLTRRNTPDS